ncbi:hypothetical protein Q5762_34925 [Streptomyces sp. P9(2023)]|uniref:hypothetical protein n=1 Tax=Streptomyces sp. P9(2023) TaxID=3064394 RepID=UPI0028F451C5|nr:hypothetical protein [Streptomyces sp. P9(2023)]MDT9693431.1 hypothetical protein [Streptomyces sp. P9(2023)]
MGFDEEWSAFRSQAAERQATSMQLNQLPADASGPTGGDSGTFGSTPGQKKAAANTIENELEGATKRATEWADVASNSAITAFDGWDTAAGLKKVQETWDQQVRVLMGRLNGEKYALRGANGFIEGNDLDIRSQFGPLAPHDPLPPSWQGRV